MIQTLNNNFHAECRGGGAVMQGTGTQHGRQSRWVTVQVLTGQGAQEGSRAFSPRQPPPQGSHAPAPFVGSWEKDLD